VFNTRVRLVGEAPRVDDAVARRNNDASRNRDYVRNYTTDSDDSIDPSFQRSRQRGWYDNSARSYYYRPQPYYVRRYYGRGYYPFGW
jgi:hypothetical protein